MLHIQLFGVGLHETSLRMALHVTIMVELKCRMTEKLGSLSVKPPKSVLDMRKKLCRSNPGYILCRPGWGMNDHACNLIENGAWTH